MDALRVLIADDHPIFRDGMRALLASVPDIEVVGEAATGDEAIAMAAELQPDVVLMDLQMPGIGGIEATRQILHASPHIRVLVVTMFEDDYSVFTAMRAGARGYIVKGAKPDEMLRAVRSVGSGDAIFSPAIAVRLIDFFSAPKPPVPPQTFPELSDREREILDLIAQGASNSRDRRAPGAQPEDGAQSRLEYLQQAAGGRSRARHYPRARRGPRID